MHKAVIAVLFGLSLSANGSAFNCQMYGAGNASYPSQFSLLLDENAMYVDGNQLHAVRFKGARLLQLSGSSLLFSVSGDYHGQRMMFLFDRSNSNYRSAAGDLSAVAKYICE